MGESAAAQPPPRGRSAADPAIHLPGSIRRADVVNLVNRASPGIAACASSLVTCEIGAVDDAALPTIDVLARLALVARRHRRHMRLEHASPAILQLLELCGLTEVLSDNGEAGDELPSEELPGRRLRQRDDLVGRTTGRTAPCRGRT